VFFLEEEIMKYPGDEWQAFGDDSSEGILEGGWQFRKPRHESVTIQTAERLRSAMPTGPRVLVSESIRP